MTVKAGVILMMTGVMASCAVADKTPVRGTKDGHGCLTAAGYTFSQVKQTCLRIFEAGIPVVNTVDSRPGMASYVVFSDNRHQAELFLPGESESVLLSRNGDVWQNARFILANRSGKWVLKGTAT